MTVNASDMQHIDYIDVSLTLIYGRCAKIFFYIYYKNCYRTTAIFYYIQESINVVKMYIKVTFQKRFNFFAKYFMFLLPLHVFLLSNVHIYAHLLGFDVSHNSCEVDKELK